MTAVRWQTKKYHFDRQEGKCHYCQQKMNWNQKSRLYCTGDHIRTKSRGGQHSRDNIVAACITCNSNRGSIPYGAFKRFVEVYGPGNKPKHYLRNLSREEYEKEFDMWNKIMGVYPIQVIGHVAQRTEQGVSTPEVAGSSPAVVASRIGRTYLQAIREMLSMEMQLDQA